MLLAGGERQHVAAAALDVHRFPHQPSGHVADVLHVGGEHAQARAAEGARDTEALALAAGDVGALAAGALEYAEGQGLAEACHQKGSGRVRPVGEPGEFLDAAEEVGRLHGDGREIPGVGEGSRVGYPVRAEGNFAHLDPGGRKVGPHHPAVERVHGARHGHLRPPRDPHGHEQRLGQGGGAVVHGGVGHLHAEQARGERLVFEDGLQRSLAHFGLIGRVRGHELRAGGQEAHRCRDVVIVAARADEHLVLGCHGHAAGQLVDVAVELPLGQGLRQNHGPAAAALRWDAGEELVEGPGAHRLQHFRNILGGVRKVAHVAHPFSLSR